MSDTARIPVVVYDDGTPNAVVAMARALEVASRVVLAVADGSPNHTDLVVAADQARVPIQVTNLPRHTGIRHALELCAEHDIYLAHVPHVQRHPGEQLRKIIQTAAHNESAGHPVLAVNIVHPDSPTRGPIVELDPAHSEAGFAALLAAGLAGTTDNPLHILRLAGDRDDVDVRAEEALHEARRVVAEGEIAVYDEVDEGDPVEQAVRSAVGARSVVLGFGGVRVDGRKLTSPDELPDTVLRTPDGHLAHELSRRITTDLIVVCDNIELHHGHLARAAVVAGAVGAMTAGTLVGGVVGLAAAAAAIGTASAGYAAVSDSDE